MMYPDFAAHGRRVQWGRVRLVLFALLTLILATACMRIDLDLVVRDADEASVDGRVTMSPVLLELAGGVDGLAASVREGMSSALDVEIKSLRDGDGWEGIAYEARGPLHDVREHMRSDWDDAVIEQTANGWRFSWEGRPFREIPPDEGFRLRLSVSLPGGLDRTNSDDTEVGGGRTTARWELDDPLEPMDFLLVTDISIPADSGLGTGAIAGIVIGATVAAALAGLLFLGRRRGHAGRSPDADREPAARES